MADKVEDFKRINEPRVGRALEQIGHIVKSATSLRVSDNDLRRLMLPIDDKLADIFQIEDEAGEVVTHQPLPDPAQEEAEIIAAEVYSRPMPHVQREMDRLSDLSTQQLVDRMIACGAELAKRRQ